MPDVLDLARLALLNNDGVVDSVEKTQEGFPLIDLDRTVAGVYPQLELHHEYGNDIQFADDELFTQRSVIELNYYCRHASQYQEFIPHMRQALRELGFTITNNYSMKDRATGIVKYAHQMQFAYSLSYLERLYEEQKKIYEEKYQDVQEPLRGTFFDAVTNQWITL